VLAGRYFFPQSRADRSERLEIALADTVGTLTVLLVDSTSRVGGMAMQSPRQKNAAALLPNVKSLSEPKWSYSSMSLHTAETMDGPMK
jgi:hypothetical protein